MSKVQEVNIKQGYKKTAIGIIPKDWEVKKLSKLSIISGDYGLNEPAIPYSSELPTYLRITDIDDNGNFIEEGKVSVKFSGDKKYYLKDRDIVFARTGASVGKSYLHNEEKNGDLAFAGFLIRFRLDTEKVHPEYLNAFTHTEHYWRWVKVYSARSGQPGLNSEEYSNLNLPVPPLHEQKAIADCLSTWDKAIEKQTQLIEAKKEFKKGLMQGFFNGSLTVKDGQVNKAKEGEDFTEDWEEVKLGNITKRITRKNDELNDTVVTISAQRGFVLQEEYFNKRVASKTLSGYYLMHNGEFAYNKSYSNGYPMGAFKRLDDFDKAVVTTLYICFAAIAKVNSNFLLYYFDAGMMIPKLMKIAQEGGRAHGLLNIGLNDFFNLELKVPTLEIQNKISGTLATVDKEINLLEQKLSALEEQKKGLMQVLLTGEKRLV